MILSFDFDFRLLVPMQCFTKLYFIFQVNSARLWRMWFTEPCWYLDLCGRGRTLKTRWGRKRESFPKEVCFKWRRARDTKVNTTPLPQRNTSPSPQNKKDCLEAKSQPCHSLFVLVRCPASTWPTYPWFLFPGYWGKSTWAHSSLSDNNFCLQVVTVSLMKNAKNTYNNEEQRLLLNIESMLLR